MNLLATLLIPLLAANVAAVTNQGTPCLSSCSKWSNSLMWCYEDYGLSPSIEGYTNANNFLGCLCEGHYNKDESWGNSTMSQAAGLCQSCTTTPREIKANLVTFLTLCSIQAQNGTAANATSFAPLKYVTADDPRVGVPQGKEDSGAGAGAQAQAALVGSLALVAAWMV